MKFYRMLRVSALFAGTAIVYHTSIMAQSLASLTGSDKDKMKMYLAAEISKLNPDASIIALESNSRIYVDALPDIQSALNKKSCAGRPCSAKVRNQALLDLFVISVQDKNYGIIDMNDVGKSLEKTSYISVWSEPPEADFKLLLGAAPVWVEKTNNERFFPKADYVIHIEKAGYEPFDGPCSNRKDEGKSCGATLRKKN